MEDRTLLDFLAQAEKLKCNTRHSWTSSDRHESVAEHSWRLVLMAYLMKDEFPDTDIAKVMLMCAVHDLGEAVTGDIPAFEKTKADEQVEEKAVAGLFDTLPEPYHTELTQLFAEMEERKTPEAKLYKALDKLGTDSAQRGEDFDLAASGVRSADDLRQQGVQLLHIYGASAGDCARGFPREDPQRIRTAVKAAGTFCAWQLYRK